MSSKILVHSEFERAAKKLGKKYRSFEEDLRKLVAQLKIDPNLGVSLGKNLRKIRLPIKSKSAGKSGGARVITYVLLIEDTVYLLTVYDKSDADSIAVDALAPMIEQIERERGS
jgi:mRNA-degrading endonuclease RelE of RelBE toxin-antitoxin system